MASHFLSTLVRFVFWQLLTTIAVLPASAAAFRLPLFTSSSHITDTTGARVQLTCVSWAGHLEANIPEGLQHNSLSSLAFLIKSSGFNCVRLTSSTWLWTRDDDDDNSSLPTVFHHFQSLNLTSAIAGIQLYNPHLVHQTLRSAHESVVTTLASHDLMVILDNHVSKPQWCCGDTDGNGFWGDEHFNPEEWLQGLVKVAMRFRGVSHVVGMSLRNELRGRRQNGGDWERYVTQATSAVHGVNPHVLIIAGGLNYASDFSFWGTSDGGDKLVALAPGKFVYEFHWYKWFARGSDFDDAKDKEACATVVEGEVRGRSHSHQKGEVPHFLSEFGVKQEGDLSYGDGRFLECVIEYLKEEQEGWALWALQGSYYLRKGVQDFEETFGVLEADWHSIRNPELIARLRPIQGFV